MAINLNNKKKFVFSGPNSNLQKKLNLNYIKWTNKTYTMGDRDMLRVISPSNIDIDYLALYSKPFEYHKTENTALCFYEFDDKFDGKNGLWNAIYYGNERLLNEYKKRFNGVKYFIAPDYSLCGDGLDTTNAYNINRARIVSIWLTIECNALVIPNITYADEKSFRYNLDGLEDCETVAFSVKGSMNDYQQLTLLKKTLYMVINRLAKLHTIVVYSVSTDNGKVLDIFQFAIAKGITILIPDNLLKLRNLALGGNKNGKI